MESKQPADRPAQAASGPGAGTPADIDGDVPLRRGGKIDNISESGDIVQESSEESFPASDPPSYTPRSSSGPSGP